MTIKKCERGEYSQALAMMNKAFGLKENELENMLPSCTPFEGNATDEQISRHFIALKDSEVIGCAGAYPSEVRLGGGETVKAFGVGQVCVRKEERGAGVMTACLSAAIADAVDGGAELGYLWGHMPRYAHFGFAPAGAKAEFKDIVIGRLIKNSGTKNFTARRASREDVAELSVLYGRYEFRAVRTEEQWFERLNRSNVDCYYSPDGAYLFANNGGNTVVEIQGGPEAARGLLAFYAAERGLERIGAQYPLIRGGGDGLFELLYSSANWFSVGPTALAAVYGNGERTAALRKIFWENGTSGDFWISPLDEV